LKDRADLRVEWWPLARVIPYGKNPRVIPAEASAKATAALSGAAAARGR
jgi:hypothetical protein